MPHIFNRPEELPKRRYLRRHATYAERVLWNALRQDQILGVSFRRQYSVNQFVLDFYAPAVRCAIEVDGATHDDPRQKVYDRQRQREIETLGIVFLRFTDEEVITKGNWVVERIENGVRELLQRR